jgi:poly-gamma-glutamate synthesis protein (capsule biosynthesis protein)
MARPLTRRLAYAAAVLLIAGLASGDAGAGALPGTDPAAGPGATARPSPAVPPGPPGNPTPRPPIPTSPPPPPPATTLTVVAAGDLLVPPLLTRQAAADAVAAGREGHDFTGILASVQPVIQGADLAICHLEQPLAEPEGPFPSFPYFAAPPQLADAIAGTGFDTCSTASNHSLDSGMAGIVRTLDLLDRVGVAHAGTARSEREAATPTIVDVNGVPVGHLSYTFSFNGLPLPPGSPWAANLLEAGAVLEQARRARDAGAEIVIASLHWGTEYQVAPDRGQLALAEHLLAAPELDLIIGHHAHVVQPFELIGGKWVAYGLGNLITRFPDGSREHTQDSVLPRFTFTRTAPGRWEVTGVEVVAAWMEYQPAARVVNLPAALATGDLSGDRRARYQRISDRIAGYVMGRGAGRAGLRMVPPTAAPASPAPWPTGSPVHRTA